VPPDIITLSDTQIKCNRNVLDNFAVDIITSSTQFLLNAGYGVLDVAVTFNGVTSLLNSILKSTNWIKSY
jgi:hypothetical protein